MRVVRKSALGAMTVALALGATAVGVSAKTTHKPTHKAAPTKPVPANGVIQVFARPIDSTGSTGSILITGVIGDYGKYVTIEKNGKVNPNGNYVKVTLKKGTFEFNSTALNKKAVNVRPSFNSATCSGFFEVTGPNTIFGGTGLYAGISGNANVTEAGAFLASRIKSGKNKGQCDTSSNATAVDTYGTITALGTVSFSG
ncbi:MAG TPA: hypothetical protein VGG38_14755 [Acidimicrobiales bacterium]|jgi:hypothetical protein